MGQFPQSERWARVKALDGWQRHHVWLPGPVRGGFQILWTVRKHFLRIGYVSKGPVLETEGPQAVSEAVRELKAAAKSLGLHALLVQPPDRSQALQPLMTSEGFQPNRIQSVVDANLEIDLSRDWSEVEQSIHAPSRKRVRQATRRGVRVREGSLDEIPEFFQLMVETCKRQRTRPNPGSLAALEAVWREFHPRGMARLTFAELSDRVVAGLFCLSWNGVYSQWKKGWSEESSSKEHPNHLLCHEALRWAWEKGYQRCDFQALNRATALHLLEGGTIGESIRRSRDFFNLSFGGVPVLLPSSMVWFPNPVFRRTYALLKLAKP